MSIEPQFTFDNLGNPIGVFLPIEVWNKISEQMHLELPDWQKSLIDIRLDEYSRAPQNTREWNQIFNELKSEDESF